MKKLFILAVCSVIALAPCQDKKGTINPAELQNDVDFLAEFSTMVKTLDFAGRVALDEEGKEIFTFGKHRNKRVEDVVRRDPNFFNWIRQGDFPLNTKQVVEALWLKYK